MYEALQSVAKDLNSLDAMFKAPDSRQRVARVSDAFDETARRISAATQSAANDEERSALQKLYRGMLAARRIVVNLYEKRG